MIKKISKERMEELNKRKTLSFVELAELFELNHNTVYKHYRKDPTIFDMDGKKLINNAKAKKFILKVRGRNAG